MTHASTFVSNSVTLTHLEFKVFTRVRDGQDPWKAVPGKSPRTHSAAVGRLVKKGLIRHDVDMPYTGAMGYVLTVKGEEWLR